MDTTKLRAAILEKMATVIDPETGVDVVRMRLIEDLDVKEDGRVSYTFRPSSAFCPIAVPLANEIQLAVAEVPGVTSQEMQIVGYAFGKEMATLLQQAMDEKLQKIKEDPGEEPPQ
jgi:metal-sulfur cluster biosynthetic enzyme